MLQKSLLIKTFPYFLKCGNAVLWVCWIRCDLHPVGEREEKLFNYLTPSPIIKNGMLFSGGCRIGISRVEIVLRLNGGELLQLH